MATFEQEKCHWQINSFFLTPIVPSEVEKIIDALNVKKATGPMNIFYIE